MNGDIHRCRGCEGCFSVSRLGYCKRCQMAAYCSADCRRRDKRKHERDCDELAEFYARNSLLVRSTRAFAAAEETDSFQRVLFSLAERSRDVPGHWTVYVYDADQSIFEPGDALAYSFSLALSEKPVEDEPVRVDICYRKHVYSYQVKKTDDAPDEHVPEIMALPNVVVESMILTDCGLVVDRGDNMYIACSDGRRIPAEDWPSR